KAEDYPGAKPEMLVSGSVVFRAPAHRVDLRNHYNWWAWMSGADWRHPEGSPRAEDRPPRWTPAPAISGFAVSPARACDRRPLPLRQLERVRPGVASSTPGHDLTTVLLRHRDDRPSGGAERGAGEMAFTDDLAIDDPERPCAGARAHAARVRAVG